MANAAIVTLANASWIAQAKQLFSSVYWNAGWQGDYVLLTDYSCTPAELSWFTDRGIIVKQTDQLQNESVGSLQRPPFLLNKLYIFTPYFKRWEKIIYLDADVVVLGSLDVLLNVMGFGAVRRANFFLDEAATLRSQFRPKVNVNKLSSITGIRYDFSSPSFNSGVLVFATSLIDETLFARLLSFFEKSKSFYRMVDQPLLNLFFYGRWQALPTAYNVLVRNYVHSGFLTKLRNPFLCYARVLHFNGLKKPWQNSHSVYHGLWKKNFDQAEFMMVGRAVPMRPNKYAMRKIYYFFCSLIKKY